MTSGGFATNIKVRESPVCRVQKACCTTSTEVLKPSLTNHNGPN